MELAGGEKKIQALFHELRLEDERVAPGFLRVWNHAQATTPRPPRAFKISFAMGLALLVLSTLGFFAIKSRDWQAGQQPNLALVSGSAAGLSVRDDGGRDARGPSAEPKQFALDQRGNRITFNRRRLAAHRRAKMLAIRRAEIRNAQAIASWQSPTATLMQSPVDEVLTSLPQLSQSVTELKSFLPNAPQ